MNITEIVSKLFVIVIFQNVGIVEDTREGYGLFRASSFATYLYVLYLMKVFKNAFKFYGNRSHICNYNQPINESISLQIYNLKLILFVLRLKLV